MNSIVKTVVMVFVAIIAVSIILSLIKGLLSVVAGLIPLAIVVLVIWFIYKKIQERKTL
jgi:hypothetical protein